MGVLFYIAEGVLAIGGKAMEKGYLGLRTATKDTLDLVFYHEEITVKVCVNYTVGCLRTRKKSNNDEKE